MQESKQASNCVLHHRRTYYSQFHDSRQILEHRGGQRLDLIVSDVPSNNETYVKTPKLNSSDILVLTSLYQI
jgi:hypothetical protein